MTALEKVVAEWQRIARTHDGGSGLLVSAARELLVQALDVDYQDRQEALIMGAVNLLDSLGVELRLASSAMGSSSPPPMDSSGGSPSSLGPGDHAPMSGTHSHAVVHTHNGTGTHAPGSASLDRAATSSQSGQGGTSVGAQEARNIGGGSQSQVGG